MKWARATCVYMSQTVKEQNPQEYQVDQGYRDQTHAPSFMYEDWVKVKNLIPLTGR